MLSICIDAFQFPSFLKFNRGVSCFGSKGYFRGSYLGGNQAQYGSDAVHCAASLQVCSSPCKPYVPKLFSRMRARLGEKGSNVEATAAYRIKVLQSIDDITEEEWDSCAYDSAGVGKENPFVLWGFYKALEDSKSAVREVGWAPSHVTVRCTLKLAFPKPSYRIVLMAKSISQK